jgi:hypothetical protein
LERSALGPKHINISPELLDVHDEAGMSLEHPTVFAIPSARSAQIVKHCGLVCQPTARSQP